VINISSKFLFKYFVPFLLSIATLLILSACSDQPESLSKPSIAEKTVAQPAKPVKDIALVMKTLTNPFFQEMERGARRAEKDLNINLLVKTAAQETSIQQQIGIVEQLIQDEIDAIIIAPGDSVELIPVLKQAHDQGIVVINIDNQLDPAFSKQAGLNGVPFISVDNEQAAYQSAKIIADKIKQPTSVAILEGIRGAKNAEDRKNGALRAFKEQENANVVAMKTAHWKIDEGYSVTEQIFTENPDVGALFCANDMMALGAIKYLQSTGKKHVLVAAYDALESAIEAIKTGKLVVTVDQQAAEQGYKGVLYAHRALAGETLPEVTLINTRIVTSETLTK